MHVYYVERTFSRPEPLRRIGLLAATHHERMDGSGYPEGITGTRIPQEARIIAVVDVFEALAGERTYRSPASAAESFAIMHRMALDQGIVSLFERTYGEFATYQPPRWTLEFSQVAERG